MESKRLIAFDADDTLWHNETLYQETLQQVAQILSPYASRDRVVQALDETEMRNLQHYGYGAKSFILSLIEMSIGVSEHRIRASEIEQILQLGRGMITAEMKLLEGVEGTLAILAETYPLMVITKGDLLDQEAKLARSGLADYIKYFETVTDKTVETYQKILNRYNVLPDQFIMIGNSLKSDILPVIQLGGYAVFIPYEITWSLEMKIEGEINSPRFYTIERMTELPGLISRIAND